jgi:hypothetical protein
MVVNPTSAPSTIFGRIHAHLSACLHNKKIITHKTKQ